MQNSPVKWIKLIENGTAEDGGATVTICLGFGDDETVRSGRLDVTLPNPIPWGAIEAIKYALDLLAVGRIAYPEPLPCAQPDDEPTDPAKEAAAYEASGGAAVTTEKQWTGGAAVMPDSESDEEVVDDDE